MPAKRQDPKAARMYALYQEGASLEAVGNVFHVSRQNVWKMFKRRNWTMRACAWLPWIMWQGRKYSLRSSGYYARTTRQRGLLHRDIWRHSNGPIPCGFQVHHKDGNKQNNDISNLELISEADHTRYHFHTCPQCGYQFWKDKKRPPPAPENRESSFIRPPPAPAI